MKNKWKFILWVCVALAALWLLWGNLTLKTTTYTLPYAQLPQAFDGFRIAQVSDLHNRQLGLGNRRLLRRLTAARPDVIVLTGDLINCSHTKVEVSLSFLKEATAIAPCYYVTGNHESWVKPEVYRLLEEGMEALGVTVLHNDTVTLSRQGDQLILAGVDDPSFAASGKRALGPSALKQLTGESAFCVLLSHRPEYFDSYVQAGIPLVLTGHAHGGQFRLPWLGGVYAPGQGLFPTYDAGLFAKDGTRMIISRGIGNSVIPLRIGNRPELVVAELVRP